MQYCIQEAFCEIGGEINLGLAFHSENVAAKQGRGHGHGGGAQERQGAMQCNVRLYLMYLTELGARLRLVLHTRHPSFDRRRLARYLSSVRRRVASHTQNIRASPPALVGIRKDSTCVAKKLLIRPISYVSPKCEKQA